MERYMAPEISIIVPVYCAEKYIHQCIESILEQTFLNFELILVDDGSPDNCGAICDEYARRDNRIQAIHQKNQGQAAARNHGIAHARGKWISFVDSDDVLHPQIIELLYNAVIENHVKLSMCLGLEAREIPSAFYTPITGNFETFIVDEKFLEEIMKDHCYWVVWGKLIKKEIVEKIPFTSGKIYEDNAVVCQWIYDAGQVASLKESLYFYRINDLSTTKSKFSLKQTQYLWALKEQITFYRKIHFKEMYRILCSRYIVSVADYSRRVLNELDNETVSKQLQRNLIHSLIKYWRYISLSKEQQLYVWDVGFPKIMSVYWIGVQIIHTVCNDGIFELFKKIKKHIVGENNEHS